MLVLHEALLIQDWFTIWKLIQKIRSQHIILCKFLVRYVLHEALLIHELFTIWKLIQ